MNGLFLRGKFFPILQDKEERSRRTIDWHPKLLTTNSVGLFWLPASCWILVSWGSEATPWATPFFKRAYKISHPLGLWAFWDALPSFASSAQSAKIGFSKWIFYVKNHPNLSDFFSLNNNRLDNIFCWKNDFLLISIFKSLEVVKSGPIFDQAEKLGKPCRDAYNPGLWLIL